MGVEGQALDSLVRQSDEAEAKILAARRKEPTVPWEQVKAELGLTPANEDQAEATAQARLTRHAAGARGGVFPIAIR